MAREGEAAFEAGELEKALDLLERAFALEKKPNLVFNIGRIHEELGHLQLAIEQYELFVTWPGVDIDTREFAAQRAARLRSILAGVSTPDEPSEEPTPAGGSETSTTPVTQEVDSRPDPVSSGDKQGKRSPMLISGVVLLGVGAAALVTGGALGGVALARTSDADDEEFVDDEAELRDSARTLARAADGLLVAGGAIAVVGIALVTVHVVKAKKQRAVSWVPSPSVGPRTVGLGWTGRF